MPTRTTLKGVDALLDHDDIAITSVRLNSDAAKGSAQWDAMLYSLDESSTERRDSI